MNPDDTITVDCINPLRWPGHPSSLVTTLWANEHTGTNGDADTLLYVALRRDTLRILLQPDQLDYILNTVEHSPPHPPYPPWPFTQNLYVEYPEPSEADNGSGLFHGILVPKIGNAPDVRSMVLVHTDNLVA